MRLLITIAQQIVKVELQCRLVIVIIGLLYSRLVSLFSYYNRYKLGHFFVRFNNYLFYRRSEKRTTRKALMFLFPLNKW